MSRLDRLPQWNALHSDAARLQKVHLRELFHEDPLRAQRFSLSACGIYLDYSKQLVDNTTLDRLIEVAEAQNVVGLRNAMFAGDAVNNTEQRAAWHVGLRMPDDAVLLMDGRNILKDISAVRSRMKTLVGVVHDQAWKGFTGLPITDVVNIGIGGSDLGPQMAMHALKPYVRSTPRVHFVSNADGADLGGVISSLDAGRTLFIVASKTFTTIETMTNAAVAREWIVNALGDKAIKNHFVAVTAAPDKAEQWGILRANVFPFWDWVGGRFSLWSAIGLPLMMAVGPQAFEDMLAGARRMDEHFRDAPLSENMPAILALLNVWNINFLRNATQAIAPYNQCLFRFPAFLQQLIMESNGKRVTRDGIPVDYQTATVVWGEPGINGQHAYFQMLHQGTQSVPVDIIVSRENPLSTPEQHRLVLASAIAQAEAFMKGKTTDEVRAEMKGSGLPDQDVERLASHRTFPGNRPSNFLLLEKLDPKTLGALIALYEHRVFAEAAIWSINPFDQWGVELGKQLAVRVLEELSPNANVGEHDSSTSRLINMVRER